MDHIPTSNGFNLGNSFRSARLADDSQPVACRTPFGSEIQAWHVPCARWSELSVGCCISTVFAVIVPAFVVVFYCWLLYFYSCVLYIHRLMVYFYSFCCYSSSVCCCVLLLAVVLLQFRVVYPPLDGVFLQFLLL